MVIKLSQKEFFDDFDKYVKIPKEKKVFIIGVCGGSGSGKSYIASKIKERLDDCIVIKMDDYYIRGIHKDNKDIPDALNLDLLGKHIEMLHNGKEINKPVYTFGLKKDYSELLKPGKVIILDGLFALSKRFLKEIDLKIFVDAPEEVRLKRRIKRDEQKRGYDKEHTLRRWKESIQPAYLMFIVEQMDYSDFVIFNN